MKKDYLEQTDKACVSLVFVDDFKCVLLEQIDVLYQYVYMCECVRASECVHVLCECMRV